jgi:lipid kinase YegS
MIAKPTLFLQSKAACDPRVRSAVEIVRGEDRDLQVIVPYDKAEHERLVGEALDSGVERLIAGGGDGTLNDVTNIIVGNRQSPPDVTLGVLPLGTANDFARGCNLPATDLAECLRIACDRPGRLIDVGALNGRSFINVASMGFGAEITATTPANLKKALGGTAYSLMGLLKALNLSPYPGRLEIPGKHNIEGSILFAAVGNNRFAGGGFEVAPLAKLDDGLLDLVAIRIDQGLSLTSIGSELDDPTNPDNVHVTCLQLDEFTVVAPSPLHCNLDGEPITASELHFSVIPRHLKVAY